RPRGRRDGHLGQPARVAQGRRRGDPRRRRVVRRRPLRAGARARRRPGPGRPRARARDAARGPGAAVDARRDGLPPEPGRPLALDRRGARAAVHGERRLGFGYGVRRLGHGLLPGDAERDLPRARSAADAAARRARPRRRAAEPRRARGRPARVSASRRAPGDDRRELPRRRRAGFVSRVLVTGGAGFIGSNLVAALLERGDDVRVLDNFSTGSRANLAALGRDVDVVEGDLRSYERVHTAVRGTEVVFHQGALGSVPRSVQDPLSSTAVNVEGTLNVLLAARDEGIRRIVAASSSSVYGDGGTFPRAESQAPNPISPYAVAKLAAERFCVSFTRVYGI